VIRPLPRPGEKAAFTQPKTKQLLTPALSQRERVVYPSSSGAIPLPNAYGGWG